MTFREASKLPTRKFADQSHKMICESDHIGHHQSPDAIGGFYGIQWYCVFEDGEGEEYAVLCYDGVYRSKDCYPSDPAEEYSFMGGISFKPFNPVRFKERQQ